MKSIILCLIFIIFSFFLNKKEQINKKDFIPEKYLKNYVANDVDRALVTKSNDLIDITFLLPRGYVKDGTKDYTTEIQKGIDVYNKILLPDFPILINDNGLKLKSNSVIVFNKNSKLIKSITDKTNYDILKLSNINNVKVFFANIEGDRYYHKSNKGEWGMGIGIWSCSNIDIISPNIKYCWGDGIYVNNCNNILIKNAITNNNRRNGVSLISGQNIIVDGLLSANNNGTAPMAGIDIEPNNNEEELKNIKLINILTYNNLQGLLIALEALNGKKAKDISIDVNNHKDDFSSYSLALHINRKKLESKKMTGIITINNVNWINEKKQNLLINKDVKYKNSINVNINGFKSLKQETQKKIKEINSF